MPSPYPPAPPGRIHHDPTDRLIRRNQPHRLKEVDTSPLIPIVRRSLRRLPIVAVMVVTIAVVLAPPAVAATSAPTLSGVIDNLRNWIVGILATVATLFLTIGGLRYLTAGGDPGQVEKAKTALKSAAIGYALAILAPLLVSILASVVGG